MPALSKRKVQGKPSGGRPKKSKEAELPLESNDEPVPDESALGSNGNLQSTDAADRTGCDRALTQTSNQLP